MKINGVNATDFAPHFELLVIPRSGVDYAFKAYAIESYDGFNELCKRPEPPIRMLPGDIKEPALDDAKFLEKRDVYIQHHSDWMFINSLVLPEGVEWSNVDKLNPDTWANAKDELLEFFGDKNTSRLIYLVIKANGLSEEAIEEATERFLTGQAEQEEKLRTLSQDQVSTQSGEPVKDSV